MCIIGYNNKAMLGNPVYTFSRLRILNRRRYEKPALTDGGVAYIELSKFSSSSPLSFLVWFMSDFFVLFAHLFCTTAGVK